MEVYLSKRLQEVATFVPVGSRLLDVGSDHAYLPLALMQQGRLEFAIAGEVVHGPYQSALTNVDEAGFSDQIAVRLADGLAAFDSSDQISVITICGMGGRLIADILDKGRAKLKNVQRLILQPNNREDELRHWLTQQGFSLIAEKILVENDKIYEIIVAEQGEEVLTADQLRFGPHLLREKSPIFMQKWTRELAKLEHALSQVPQHYQSERAVLEQKIQQIKEVVHES